MKPEDYTHRIGRTGRAGRNGIAITLAEHRDRIKIRAIERFTQQPMTAAEIEGLEPQLKPSFTKPRQRPNGNKRSKPKFGAAGRSGSGPRFASRSNTRSGSHTSSNSKY